MNSICCVKGDLPKRKPMLSREEFDSVISVFLVELTYLTLQTKEEELRALPRFAPIMEECVNDLRDPSADASLLLYRAFGYVDVVYQRRPGEGDASDIRGIQGASETQKAAGRKECRRVDSPTRPEADAEVLNRHHFQAQRCDPALPSAKFYA